MYRTTVKYQVDWIQMRLQYYLFTYIQNELKQKKIIIDIHNQIYNTFINAIHGYLAAY